MIRKIITFIISGISLTVFAQSTDIFNDVVTSDVTSETKMQKPDVWTFDDCLNWAISNSTDIRQTYLSILQSDEEIGAAKDAWLPTVGFSTNHSFSNYISPQPGQKNNIYGSSYAINAAWTLWEGNVRKYRLQSAKLYRRQQTLSGEDVVKNLKLGILQAYLNIMYANEAVLIARQTLEVSTLQTERARRLMETGHSSKVDYAQIESQKAQDEYGVVQAEGNLATAKMNLKKILSLSLDYDIEIDSVSFTDSDVLQSLPEMNETYNLASSWLPGIQRNELNKDIYDNDIKIAKAGYLPNVSLQGGLATGYSSGGSSWGYQMGHGFNENVGLSLSIPIYDGNSTKRAVAKARLSALEYDINKENLLNELSQTIESLYVDASNAKTRYKAGQAQLESSILTADLVQRQFELGKVNTLELLTAHSNLINARFELLQSKYLAVLSNKTIEYYATQEINLP